MKYEDALDSIKRQLEDCPIYFFEDTKEVLGNLKSQYDKIYQGQLSESEIDRLSKAVINIHFENMFNELLDIKNELLS
ncbi:hypothetical protein [Ekhidna sp.]|uniref:hypothetical protein n=1 Tax=Ekhidna sp. TaxID=2608089 RepID=UPI003C7A24CA